MKIEIQYRVMREIKAHFLKNVEYVNVTHNEKSNTWDLVLAEYKGPDIRLGELNIHQMVTMVRAISGFVPESYNNTEAPKSPKKRRFRLIPGLI